MKRSSIIRATVAIIAFVFLPALAAFAQDSDADGVVDSADNCSSEANPPHSLAQVQIDADLDGIGNACDADYDQTGTVTTADFDVFLACLGQYVPGNGPTHDLTCAEADMGADGYVSVADFSLFLKRYSSGTPGTPGPSGLSCANATTNWAPCLGAFDPQTPDPNYIPSLAAPRYTAPNGPVVAVDQTHSNFHTIDGGYLGFARLLRADGYTVQAFTTSFPSDCEEEPEECDAYLEALLEVNTLVIANATREISSDEAEVIAGWLSGTLGCEEGCEARSLILIADHPYLSPFSYTIFDFPLLIGSLATELGLDWVSATVYDYFTFTPSTPPPAPTLFGLLNPDHPITLGSNSSEEIVSVTTFTGSAFEELNEQEPILTLPDEVMSIDPVTDVSGFSQGAAFDFGTGRVYASSEAGMFSAQAQFFLGRFGMQSLPRNQNQQFLLNVMHWLDGAL